MLNFISSETYRQYTFSVLYKYFYKTLSVLGSYNDHFIYSALEDK